MSLSIPKTSIKEKNHTNITILIAFWKDYLQQNSWQKMIKEIAPLHVGCGMVYENITKDNI